MVVLCFVRILIYHEVLLTGLWEMCDVLVRGLLNVGFILMMEEDLESVGKFVIKILKVKLKFVKFLRR